MDTTVNISTTGGVTPSTSVIRNTTELFIVEEGEVAILSIIVWCLGGILLISLLSLLGRIILARNKYPTDTIEYIERNSYTNNVFRIPIPNQQRRPPNIGTLSHDTMGLVPGADVAISDSPIGRSEHRSQAENQVTRSVSTNAYSQVSQHCQGPAPRNAQSDQEPNQRQTVIAVYDAEPPQILTSDALGRVATVNGSYVIRPPSYHDVVSPSTRIPSVIVSRPRVLPPRFSL